MKHVLEQMQYRFAIIYETLSRYQGRAKSIVKLKKEVKVQEVIYLISIVSSQDKKNIQEFLGKGP